MQLNEINKRIPNETLNIIRGILVKSLSKENVSETDIRLLHHRQRAYQHIGKITVLTISVDEILTFN